MCLLNESSIHQSEARVYKIATDSLYLLDDPRNVSLFAVSAASVVLPCDLIPSNHQKCRLLMI